MTPEDRRRARQVAEDLDQIREEDLRRRLARAVGALETRLDVETPVFVRHCRHGHVAVRVFDFEGERVAVAFVDEHSYGRREAIDAARHAEGGGHVALLVLRWWLVDVDYPSPMIDATCPRGHTVAVLCATIRG